MSRGRLPVAPALLAVGFAAGVGASTPQDTLWHIVRLSGGARERFRALDTATTGRPDGVWETAAALVTRRGLEAYGVLVAEAEGGGFLVVVERENVERAFTRSTCR